MATISASSDTAAVAALKLAAKRIPSGADRERIKTLIGKAATAMHDERVRSSFLRLADYLRQRQRLEEIGQSSAAPIEDLVTVGSFGLARTAEFAATELSDALTDVPLEMVLSGAPTARFVDTIAKKHKGTATAAIQMVEADATFGDRSAAVDWLVKHGKPAELTNLANLLVSKRERLPHLAGYAKLLGSALKRDKGAALLQAVLGATKSDGSARARIVAAITGDAKLFAQILKVVPKLLTTEHSGFAFRVLEDWLPRYASQHPRARESLAAALTALALSVLKKRKRNEFQQQLLDLLSRSFANSLSRIKESADLNQFWLFARASDLAQSLSDSVHVSDFGARLVATAMEKAASGNPIGSILEALALNLGMNPVASVGETAIFNPEMHEDLKGGLVSGDAVVIQAAGWAINGRPIRRAKVIPHERS